MTISSLGTKLLLVQVQHPRGARITSIGRGLKGLLWFLSAFYTKANVHCNNRLLQTANLTIVPIMNLSRLLFYFEKRSIKEWQSLIPHRQ